MKNIYPNRYGYIINDSEYTYEYINSYIWQSHKLNDSICPQNQCTDYCWLQQYI